MSPWGKGCRAVFFIRPCIRRHSTTALQCAADAVRKILITDDRGAVLGIEARVLSPSPLVTALHGLLYNLGFVSSKSRKLLALVEKRFGKTVRIRATGGVIISSGGFVYNKQKFNEYAPAYSGCLPLGTAGDDGSGMELGMSAGGVLSSVDVCAASRFLYPPVAFVSGLLANMEGGRFCDESLYGASISRAITQQPQRRAYLVIDSTIHRDGRLQTKREERLGTSITSILKGEMNHIIYRKLTTFVNLHLNRKKAHTIAGLAKKCGIPAETLVRTVESYNDQCAAGADREFGKAPGHLQRIADTSLLCHRLPDRNPDVSEHLSHHGRPESEGTHLTGGQGRRFGHPGIVRGRKKRRRHMLPFLCERLLPCGLHFFRQKRRKLTRRRRRAKKVPAAGRTKKRRS